jgi:hypothetical protein
VGLFTRGQEIQTIMSGAAVARNISFGETQEDDAVVRTERQLRARGAYAGEEP